MKKKILILTPRFPYPIIGGDKLRIYNICKQLSKHYSLTLLSLCESDEEYNAVATDKIFTRIEKVKHKRLFAYINTLFTFIFKKQPLQVAYYKNSNFAKRTTQLMDQHDAVLCHLIRVAPYVKNFHGPKILEMTDAISMNYQRIQSLKKKKQFKELIFSIEASRLRQYEKNITNHFDINFLTSSTDKCFLFNENTQPNIHICSNGVNLQQLKYTPPDVSSNTVCFIGDMRSVQNIDACEYFIQEILPKAQVQTEIQFRIIGSINPKLKKQFEQHNGVQVTGRIETIAKHTWDCFSAVCPMRTGAGIQNKILEYMALGLPTVTTTVGSQGISAMSEEDFFIRDDTRQFAEVITNLKHNHQQLNYMAKNARKYVEENHSWEKNMQPYIKLIDNITAEA